LKIRGNAGSMGISTLIILIAVILTAVLATVVLFGSSSRLQTRALDRGKKAKESLGSSFNVMNVMGSDGSDGSIEDFMILMKLQAGSEPISLNYTIISASSSTWHQTMEYNGSGTSAVGTTMYWVEWITQGPAYEPHYLNRGDIVKVRFHAGTSVVESKKVRVKIIPKTGVVSIVEFSTPSVMKEEKVNLYPLAI
jgi:archaellin